MFQPMNDISQESQTSAHLVRLHPNHSSESHFFAQLYMYRTDIAENQKYLRSFLSRIEYPFLWQKQGKQIIQSLSKLCETLQNICMLLDHSIYLSIAHSQHYTKLVITSYVAIEHAQDMLVQSLTFSTKSRPKITSISQQAFDVFQIANDCIQQITHVLEEGYFPAHS